MVDCRGGSRSTLTGSGAEPRSESAVKGSDIRPAARLPLKTHFLPGLTGRMPRDALYAEHSAQVRVKSVHTSRLRSQNVPVDAGSLMRGDVRHVSPCKVILLLRFSSDPHPNEDFHRCFCHVCFGTKHILLGLVVALD